MLDQRTLRKDRGAGTLEYAGLIVVAALILGALWATGIPAKVTPRVSTAICLILHEGDCEQELNAQDPHDAGQNGQIGQNGDQNNGPDAEDPLQMAAQASATGAGGWGPSTGHGPGNPGIGKSGDLPRGGDNPYVPPKSGRGKPVKVRGKPGYVDDKGRIWEWDRLHKDHWDVTDPKTGKHINVNPDGSEARNPDSQGEGSEDKGGNKSNSSWVPWAAGGAAVAGGGAALWWGAKLLSPACGPLVVVCAVAL